MKKIKVVLPVFFLCLLSLTLVFGQDDETRQASGLPMKIGENLANTNRANLSGKINLRGLDPNQPRPFIFVQVLYNGVMIERRQATESGNYFFQSVPRENVTIAIEINGAEVGRQQLLPSQIGSIRQDFDVNLLQGQNSEKKAGVVSARSPYPRSAENEKRFEMAMSAAKDKQRKDAIKILKQIVENDKKDFVAWSELGTMYLLDENVAEAEIAYNTSLEQNPDYIVALLNLGRLYIAEKQAEKAITVLSKAVETEPTSADAQHLLGEAYLSNKKGSKAVGYLNEAIRLAPIEKAELHLRLATLYNAAGLKGKAVEEYKQFLEKMPNHPDRQKLEQYIKDNSPK